MADKKVTDLTELTSPSQEDLLLIIDNPAGTPISKKIAVANLLGNVSFITSTTTPSATLVRSTLTSNALQTTAAVITAGAFVVNATAVATNTTHQYGVTVLSALGAAAANVKTEHAAGKFTLDVGIAAPGANSYGLVVLMANTGGSRIGNTRAFIQMTETANAVGNTTVYLLDVAGISANLSTGSGNTTAMYINSTATGATHKLKLRINGTDMWLPLSSNAT